MVRMEADPCVVEFPLLQVDEVNISAFSPKDHVVSFFFKGLSLSLEIPFG